MEALALSFAGENITAACSTAVDEQKIYPVSELGELIRQAADKRIVIFDYKKSLHLYPQLAQIDVAKIFDVKLACYISDPACDCSTVAACAGKFLPEGAASANANECKLLLALYGVLQEKMAENRVFNDIEMPLAPVLANMETRGIMLDRQALEEFGKKLAQDIAAVEKKIYSAVGKKFNINSTKQLSALLFDELKLTPAGKKTKSGYSTDAEALEKIIDQHPVINDILCYRKLAKVNSTYVEGLLKFQQPDGRIHTSFNMTATATGRLSSTEPNLQNLPVAGDLGGEVRKFFSAGEGMVLIDADYSQIELRILAHMANDPVMIAAFRSNEDIHTVTAAQIFNVNAAEVTPEMRRKAKAVNFGIVYGISAFTLANDLEISQEEAKNYIGNYFKKYAAVKSYLDKTVKDARKNGWVETLFGRRRMLPELHSKIFAVRSFGERVALNMPIQGTAADLIKIAMIKVDQKLQEAFPRAGLLLQIHDELLLSAPANEADEIAELLRRTMENAVELAVPLQVSLAVGKNYYEVK